MKAYLIASLVVVLLFLAGCSRQGDGASPDDANGGPVVPSRSGSRLKVRTTRTWSPDGFETARVSTVDALRDEECDAAGTKASDGLLRCLPTAHDVVPHRGEYLDELCSVPLGSALLGSSTGRYVSTVEVVEGEFRTTVHAATPVSTVARVFVKAMGGCSERPPMPPPFRYFVAGPEVAPSSFVQIERAVEVQP